MARKFKYCIDCRRTITEQEAARGAFVEAKDGLLCATCAQRLDEEAAPAGGSTGTGADAPSRPKAPPVEHAGASAAPAAPKPPPVAPPRASAAPVEPKPPSQTPIRERPEEKAPDSAPAEPEEPVPAQPRELLESIHRHLAAIHRTLVFEKSSTWTVLAAVAQCLALGMLALAAFNWISGPGNLLLVALIFQVMALTFFVRGK